MIHKVLYSTIIILLAGSLSAQTTLDTALNFSVKDTQGNIIELFEVLDEDKIAVIDFYTTDCAYCGLYAPDFQEAYEAFGCNTSNVYFFTIDQGHNNEEVEAFEAEHGLEMAGASGLEGNGNSVFDLYGIQSTPTMIVIKPDRELANQHIWPPEADSLISEIEEAGGTLMPCNTSADLVTKQLFEVFPNPAAENISLKGVPAQAKIIIHNYQGQKVMEAPNQKNISVKHLPFGTYFVSYRWKGTTSKGAPLIIK